MKIAGNSFAFLTQLGQDSAGRGTNAAQERLAKKAAERAVRIAQVREANQAQASQFSKDTFELGDKRAGSATPSKRDKPAAREAIDPQASQRRQEPGQVLNIVI